MNFDRAWFQWYTKMEGNVGRWIFLHLKIILISSIESQNLYGIKSHVKPKSYEKDPYPILVTRCTVSKTRSIGRFYVTNKRRFAYVFK